jgi:hypothetical protein
MDCPLFDKASFNLSWRGESVLCLVVELSSSDLSVSEAKSREVAYQVGSSTKIRFLSTDEPFLPSAIATDLRLEGVVKGSSQSPGQCPRVAWETLPFAGYQLEVEEAIKVIEAGFALPSRETNSLLPTMKFKRPRGLLLSGPRGTGKTLLMNSLTAFFSPWFASVHSLSPDILLSRFVPRPSHLL